MAVTSKKILDANVSTCAVAGTAEEVSSFIQAVDGVADKAAEMIRTAFANFDPNEKSFADLVNTLKTIGA